MNASSFSMNEFIKPAETPPEDEKGATEQPETAVVEEEVHELDVQKAVVEALAADKAEMGNELQAAKAALAACEEKRAAADEALTAQKAECAALKDELAAVKAQLARKEAELAAQMEKELDLQERNPNALALLDREIEVPDRFPGETRDHVLEVITEARAAAEAQGRVRRAQVLEAVLLANEPNGTLAKKRAALEKVFAEQAHVINGTVLALLKEEGLTHKNGEEYLLPSEILKRSY